MSRVRPVPSRVRACLALAALLAWMPADAARRRGPEPAPPPAPVTRVVVVDGEFALVGGDGGLEVVPTEALAGERPPEPIGALGLRGTVHDIAVWAPGLAFLAAGSDGVVLVDVSEPAAPRAVRRIETRGSARRLARRGDILYVADEIGGLVIVDAARPERATIRRTVSTRNQVRALAVREGVLALAEGAGGVRVFDVRRADLPRDDTALDRRRSAADVLFVGDTLLVADGRDGLDAWRERSPGGWEKVSEMRDLGRVESLSPGDGCVLAALGARGLAVLDVGDDGAISVRATAVLPRSIPVARVTPVGDGIVVAAAGIGGLAAIDLSEPLVPRVLRPRKRSVEVRWAD